MSVAVVGVNHRTLPLGALEPLIISHGHLPKALADLSSRPHLQEVVLLSTCMRTEVYAVVSRFHAAMADIRDFLATWSGQAPDAFTDHLYSYFDSAAVSHLFRVASGLDSASLGEPEVLGQVRGAAEVAHREGSSGPVLAAAFRHALVVGKRARSETMISRGTTSLSYAAVELAGVALGGLEGKSALVLGSGEVGAAAARALVGATGAQGRVVIANRTRSRAERLAEAIGAVASGWAEARTELSRADVVVCAAAGEAAAVTAGNVGRALTGRQGRPLYLVDLAVPRSVDPSVGEMAGVTLVDMDGIASFVAGRVDERRAEVPAVEHIVAEELDRYGATVAERAVAPLVASLHERAELARAAEVDRVRARLGHLGADDLEAVELLTRRLVAKLIHEPTVNLKAAAGTTRGELLADAFRELFRLEP